jgi:hypothetical protein
MGRVKALTVRLALIAGATGVALAALAAPAGAVSTDQFSLSPAAGSATHSGQVITAVANGRPDRRGVVVANRTDSPLRVTLFSEPATRSADGVYGFGGTVTAKGASVTVGANHLVLAPHASAVVPVVVRAGTSRGKRYAVVMATAGAIKEGSLSVVPRLAVLVEIQPAHGRAPASPIPGVSWPWLVLAVLLLMAAVATAWRVWRTWAGPSMTRRSMVAIR